MVKPSKITLSVIVPVFNEENGIESAIALIYQDACLNPIKSIIKSFEVIAVDDGSSDNTNQVLQKLKKRYKKLKVIKHKVNMGLGATIVTGINHATKDYVTYLPADGQALLREIYEGLKKASSADLILTYRGVRKDYNLYRHILSAVLMIFMRVFFNLNFKDYNWVHIYKKSIFNSFKIQSKGVFYLGEVVVRTREAGFNILETEAKYNPRFTGVSKNARISVALQTLKDLLKLWFELKF